MNNKFLTKLLNREYRNRIISGFSEKKRAAYKIPQYARYVVDHVLISRDVKHENDKEWMYGFSPLEVLGYVGKDGSVKTRLFEFNTVNHFLRGKDGDSAVEVVQAMLVKWASEDKDIACFDIDMIDAGLRELERQYAEREKAESEKNAENENDGE